MTWPLDRNDERNHNRPTWESSLWKRCGHHRNSRCTCNVVEREGRPRVDDTVTWLGQPMGRRLAALETEDD